MNASEQTRVVFRKWPDGDIEIVDKDESHGGDGEGDELALAHYEYYYEGATVH